MDFFTKGKKTFNRKYFCEIGLVYMIQAPDHESDEQVSSYLGSVVAIMFGNDESADATAVFTKCSKSTRFIFRNSIEPW